MSEKELFEFLRERSPELRLAEDKYSRWDCETDRSVIELKCRNKEYPTQLLERKKYRALLDDGRAPFYVVWTGKRVLLFDLRNIKFEWEERWLPATTEFGGGKVIKEVAFIPNSAGKELVV